MEKTLYKAYKISNFLVYLSIIGWLFILWQIFRPINVIDMQQPYQIINKQIRPGGAIEYISEYTKFYDYPGTVHKTVVCQSGRAYTLPSRESSIPTGSKELVSSNSYLPETAVPNDTCYLDVRVQYHVNAFRDVNYAFVTESFDIVE